MIPPTTRATLAALATACACGPPQGDLPRDVETEAHRYAEAMCSTREACDCHDGRFSSRDACELEQFTEFMSVYESGLAFSGDCLDQLMTSDAMSCAEWPWDHSYSECPTLEGTKAEGEFCVAHWELLPLYASDCAGGMSCIDSVCVTKMYYPPSHQLGEPCVNDGHAPCDTGLYCADDGHCQPDSLAGEACTHPMGCELGTFCTGLVANGVGVCAEKVAPSGDCDPKDWRPCDLATPLETSFSWCAPPTYTCELGHPGICLLSHPFWNI